ncbi:MAG: hypothetical protein M0Q49_05670 [Porticoccaceae bacterium]|nr:hypothetical protein [Porticoccaceae bacterium]
MPLIRDKLTPPERKALKTIQKHRDYHRVPAADFFAVYGDHECPGAEALVEANETLSLAGPESAG